MTGREKAAALDFPPSLVNFLEKLPPLAIAFSGGLDSRFLCHAAVLAGHDILAIHASGPHIAPDESQFAREWAAKRGIDYLEIAIDPLNIREVAENSRNRCYACKKNLFIQIRNALRGRGQDGRSICDGGNMDDLSLFRPGTRAAREAGVISPLAEAALGKKEIRFFAKKTGMDFPEQMPRPCILTRLAYGLEPDRKTMLAIAKAEKALEKLLKQNDRPQAFRLRITPRPVVHISPGAEEFYPEIRALVKKYGFDVDVRTLEQVSGWFDRPVA